MKRQLFLPATMGLSTMDTALNTALAHVSRGLRGYIQHKHTGGVEGDGDAF